MRHTSWWIPCIAICSLAAFALISIPERAPAEPSDAAAAADDADVGDGVADSKLAVMWMGNNPLSVYSKKPAGDVKSRGPYFHEQFPRVVLSSATPYDSVNRVLTFSIELADPPAESKELAKRQVAAALNEQVGSSLIEILPLELQAYEVFLKVGDEQIALGEGRAAQGPFTGVLKFVKRVDSDSVHELLQNSNNATVVFRPYYEFTRLSVSEGNASIVQEATQSVLEDLFGGDAPATFLVARNSKSKIETQLTTQVRWVFPRDASSAMQHFMESAQKAMSEMAPLTADELAAANESLFYRSGDAHVEIQPDVLREHTTAWKNEQEFREAMQKSWDKLRDMENTSKSSEEFYNKLHQVYKTAGSSSASVGVLDVFNGSGSASFNLDITYDKLTKEKQDEFERTRKTVHDTGMVSHETLQKISQEWTGDSDYSRITPKSLQLYRVASSALKKQLTTYFSETSFVGSRIESRTLLLDLIGPESHLAIRDILESIARHEASIATAAGQIEQASKRIDENFAADLGAKAQVDALMGDFGGFATTPMRILSSRLSVEKWAPKGQEGETNNQRYVFVLGGPNGNPNRAYIKLLQVLRYDEEAHWRDEAAGMTTDLPVP